jgi:hypothetical protein
MEGSLRIGRPFRLQVPLPPPPPGIYLIVFNEF